MWINSSKLKTIFNSLGRWLFVAGCTLALVACSSNPTSTQPSAEQSELYEGQPILSYIAGKQAKTPEEAILRARQAQLEQDNDRALYEYIRAYELDDKHTEALLQIANIHYTRKNYRIAYLAYQKALYVDPDLITAHQGAGLILLRQKQHNLALESFTKAVALEQQQRAEQEQANEQIGEQADEQTVEKAEPKHSTLHSTLAIESYNGLGIIYDMKGMYEEARLNYQAALDINANNKVVLNNLGYSYYLESKWQQAESYFSRALHVNSAYQPAWKNLGLVYARQEKYLLALEALEQVMETPQAYNDIGYICLLSRRYEHAVSFFRKAISANPQYYEVAQQNLLRVKRLVENELANNKGN